MYFTILINTVESEGNCPAPPTTTCPPLPVCTTPEPVTTPQSPPPGTCPTTECMSACTEAKTGFTTVTIAFCHFTGNYPKPLVFELGGITYPNNTIVLLEEIGEGDIALL